jgi:GrpB-like predicted nucleotidyltransferase (UPF0157 family)
MRITYEFEVREVAHVAARGLLFVSGSARWGAAIAIGHRASWQSGDGFDAPIAAVESALRSGDAGVDLGLGFRYADEAELQRWLGLPLVGARLLITRPAPAPVIVGPYDPAWPAQFDDLQRVWAAALAACRGTIHHVGSTAVPGLAAKPIIDVDIEIPGRDQLPAVVQALEGLGYRHSGDLGLPGREAFARGGAEDVPRDGSGRRWTAHNLYVCASDCAELQRHLLFRDWLRAHPESAAEYGALKQRLALAHRDDRESYIEGKTALVESILRAAEAARSSSASTSMRTPSPPLRSGR